MYVQCTRDLSTVSIVSTISVNKNKGYMREDIQVLVQEGLKEFDETNLDNLEEVHTLLGFLRGTLWMIEELIEK